MEARQEVEISSVGKVQQGNTYIYEATIAVVFDGSEAKGVEMVPAVTMISKRPPCYSSSNQRDPLHWFSEFNVDDSFTGETAK